MSEPRDKFVDSQGLPIHCLEWGEPAGEPLVLVHGYWDIAQSWSPFVTALQKELGKSLWIVAPNCRGHGDSGRVGAGAYYYFPDYVLDLDRVVRALGATQFKLIGHSMGGTISFLYTGTFPRRVSRLVLIEGIGPPGMKFSDAPLRMEKWITEVHERGRGHFREYTSVEAGASQLRQTNPRLNAALALDLARAGMNQNDKGKWVWKFDPLHRTAAPQPFYTEQALEFFRRIECLVLIVEGEASRQTRRTDKQVRYDAIRNHRRVIIDHAGHMVHHDKPMALAEIIAPFLKL
jgi:pimeloyl-ACP methyl ester carboxylesterase